MGLSNLLSQSANRKVFISFHQKDKMSIETFIKNFNSVFTPKILGANDNDDYINSTNTDYVMSCIRQRYLQDSSITIVMMGQCTHSRRYVDWEIKVSLTQGQSTPNGLIGILLPEFAANPVSLPERFKENWNNKNQNCYARYYHYPTSSVQLRAWIEDAYSAKTTRNQFINNSNDIMKYNSQCKVHGITH